MSQTSTASIDTLLQQIAREHLRIDTLEARNQDQLDFHEVSVWSLQSALQAAYEAGRQSAQKHG